jgi:hypothetical protein
MEENLLLLHHQLIDNAEIIDERNNERANELLRQVDVAEVRSLVPPNDIEMNNGENEELVTMSHLLLSSKASVMGSENYIEKLYNHLYNNGRSEEDQNNDNDINVDDDEEGSDNEAMKDVDGKKKIFDANVPLKITKTNEPMNEFGANDVYLQTLFPTLFLLGRFGNDCDGHGTLPKPFVQHLLRQRSTAFAHDIPFLFTLLNQRQRHAVSQSVAARAVNNSLKMEELAKFLNDDTTISRFEEAIKDPNGFQAQSIIKQLEPLVKLINQRVDFSPAQRSFAISELYAYVQYYGCPTVFFTLSPDDTHSILSMRYSFPSQTTDKFPVKDSNLRQSLRDGDSEFLGSIDISYLGLDKLVGDNPGIYHLLFFQFILYL